MLTIKVLGSGCPNCRKVEANAVQAIEELHMEADIVHVTNRAEMFAYPILSTPGLVINEQVVSYGRIPRKEEIMDWLKQAAAS